MLIIYTIYHAVYLHILTYGHFDVWHPIHPGCACWGLTKLDFFGSATSTAHESISYSKLPTCYYGNKVKIRVRCLPQATTH